MMEFPEDQVPEDEDGLGEGTEQDEQPEEEPVD
jgi:hypothetical protein